MRYLWYATLLALLLVPPARALGSMAEEDADANARESSTSRVPQRLNPTGHGIALTVPVTVDAIYLGDTALTIDATDRVSMPAGRILELLSQILSPKTRQSIGASLGQQSTIGLTALAELGISMRYDPQRIELVLSVPPGLRATRTLEVSELGRPHYGDYETPARFSGYLNVRSSLDHLEQEQSPDFLPPIIALDGATRLGNVVLESESSWQPGAVSPDAQRQGTRLVYDDRDDLVRWTLGDLLPVARGFQSAPEMAGISLFRSYSVLQPEMIARPTGTQSFRLTRSASVEIWVDGRLVRRMFLEPGSYDLRDFPYTQGINDVRVIIQDDTGQIQTLHFNLFSDQTQLARGLSEFGLYAGVKAPLGPAGPAYSQQGELTGFYRRGLTDRWTIGANIQGDAHSAMGGLESMVSGPLGALGANLAASDSAGLGGGVASIFTFERMTQRSGGRWDSWNLSAQTWSTHFAPLGALAPAQTATSFGSVNAVGPAGAASTCEYAGLSGSSPNASSAAAAAASSLRAAGASPGAWCYANPLTAASIARLNPYVYQVGAAYSHAFNPIVDIGLDLHYGHSRAPFAAAELYRLVLGWHPTPALNVSAESDYQNPTAGMPGGVTFLLSVTARLDAFSSVQADYDGRERLTRLAFADGAFSVGRPIYDSFAIVTRHGDLEAEDVVLDPLQNGYTARTTILGTATDAVLGSYMERTLRVDVPDAPADIDLGKGAFRLFPPYRSGYRLQVGTEYSVTAVGRLLGRDGAPLALVSGTAMEEPSGRNAVSIALFTNGDGRFGLAGVRPGLWRIQMQTEPGMTYELEIAAGIKGAARVGDLRPLDKADRT